MFRKIKNRCIVVMAGIIRNVINMWYAIKFIIFKGNYGINKREREDRIIVSLTSFPARINKVHLCIKSIFLQKMKPDKIILYLGIDEFKDVQLPNDLTDLCKYGLEIRFRKDLKPHTKYFYAMQEFPDSLIITVDDDIYYRPKLIKDLYEAYKKHPKCVICTRAHKILFSNGKLLPYNNWEFETKDTNKESNLLIATGVGGVLYNPQLFIKETYNMEYIEEYVLKQDDIWLKFMELFSKIKVYAIPSYKNKYVIGIKGAEEITLNSDNVGRSKNDVYIQTLMNVYNVTFDFFKE